MTEHKDGHGHLCHCPADADHEFCVGQDAVIDQGEVFLHRILLEEDAKDLQEVADRERAVLHFMAEGRSNAGIASEMNVVVKTVESYVVSVFAKLGLPPSADDNRRVLAVLAWLRTRAG